MDRVTKSFLEDFRKSNELPNGIEEKILFEHFANYSIVEPRTEFSFDIEKINIGSDGTIGLDGFALIINKQLIFSEDELNDYLNFHKKSYAEVIFIQAKTSPKFDSKEIGGFGYAVNDFVSEEQKLRWSDSAIEKIKLFNSFVKKIPELSEKPICSLFYISLGRDEKDQNVYARVSEIKNNISEENIFSIVNMDLIDATDIQNRYKQIGQAITKTFEYEKRVTLPVIKDVDESYIGVVSAKTILKLMTNEEGILIPNVFYDNVRDFQGNNKVNSEIEYTLKSSYKDSFSILNNGITVVAESLIATRDNFTISNYQIINGCQTSHVLLNNKDFIDDSVQVSLKLVISKNEEFISRIIRSTNRQTEVKDQDLIAFSTFQKRLEDYYKTFSGDDRLFYERRSKQYNSQLTEKKRIIDKTTQIKAVTSMFFDKPDMATRYFGALFEEFGDRLFKDNHELIPYYVSSFGLYKIESLFRNAKIDAKYKKIKYHMLAMLRHEISNEKLPVFESKKIVPLCDSINSVLKNESQLLLHINAITHKIDMIGTPINDNEVSKSKEFVKRCLDVYKHR